MSLDRAKTVRVPVFALESCEIAEWRGYTSREFYARRLVDETVLARSKSFRCRGSAAAPDTESARAAYDALAADLVAAGWKARGRGSEWFSTRFERQLALAPDAPEGASLEPVAVEPKAEPQPQPERVRAPERGIVLRSTPEVEAEGARSRTWQVLAVCVLAAVAALLAWFVVGGGGVLHSSGQAVPARTPKGVGTALPPRVGRNTSKRSPQRAEGPARVTLRGLGGGSWLEVRRESSIGPLVYRGQLAAGQALHLTGGRLWVLFGDGGNVGVVVNGRPVAVLGATQVLVTTRGLQRLRGVAGS